MTSPERQHERGLRLLGLWPGPLEGVAAARSRAAATEALVNVQALARAAKRIVARQHHPDLSRGRGNLASLSAALAAEAWLATVRVADMWSPRRQAGQRGGDVLVVEASATRIRFAYRGRA